MRIVGRDGDVVRRAGARRGGEREREKEKAEARARGTEGEKGGQ
jgi:hypothetical protein